MTSAGVFLSRYMQNESDKNEKTVEHQCSVQNAALAIQTTSARDIYKTFLFFGVMLHNRCLKILRYAPNINDGSNMEITITLI